MTEENLLKNEKKAREIVERYSSNPKYKHINFKFTNSKTTNSMYIRLTSKIERRTINRASRYSDHYGAPGLRKQRNARKKIPLKKMERDIKRMIREIEQQRLMMILKNKEEK